MIKWLLELFHRRRNHEPHLQRLLLAPPSPPVDFGYSLTLKWVIEQQKQEVDALLQELSTMLSDQAMKDHEEDPS